MNAGRTVFSQLIEFLPHQEFQKCVARYGGDRYLKNLSCWDQYLAMAFAQLTYRESSRHRSVPSRVRGEYGKSLLRRRGELVERSFAHCYETGGMRRTHLRGHENILKRQLIHVGAFNLSLIFRSMLGAGKPRELKSRHALVSFLFLWVIRWFPETQ